MRISDWSSDVCSSDLGPELAVAHDSLSETDRGWGNPLAMHVQALVTAELADGGSVHRGMGVLEQLFVGPHEPTGPTRSEKRCVGKGGCSSGEYRGSPYTLKKKTNQ